MTRWENYRDRDSGEVNDWLRNNIKGLDNVPITVEMNRDGSIKVIDIGKKLTEAEKAMILTKYPELINKEVQ